MKIKLHFAAFLIAALLLAACSRQTGAVEPETLPAQGASSEPVLHEFEGLEAFAATFNHDIGKPRLVLLLSPT